VCEDDGNKTSQCIEALGILMEVYTLQKNAKKQKEV
jgi:hypothetical protein